MPSVMTWDVVIVTFVCSMIVASKLATVLPLWAMLILGGLALGLYVGFRIRFRFRRGGRRASGECREVKSRLKNV